MYDNDSKPDTTVVLMPVKSGVVPPEYAIKWLEHALELARSGEWTSFALLAAGPDFATFVYYYSSSRMDRLTLLGQIPLLQSRLVKHEEEA